MSADYVHEQGNHGYLRAFPVIAAGANLFTPLISTADPSYATDQTNVVPNVNVFESDNRSSYNGLMLHLQGNMRRFQSGRELSTLQSTDLGMPAGPSYLTMWMASVPKSLANRMPDS